MKKDLSLYILMYLVLLSIVSDNLYHDCLIIKEFLLKLFFVQGTNNQILN